MKFRSKEETSFEQRKQEAENIRIKYPERIPVIVERVSESHVSDIGNRKFLVPNDITMGQFMWIIRKRIQLAPEDAIYGFVNKTNSGMFKFINNFKQHCTIPQLTSTMGQIYAEHKDDDGFLYVAYAGENMFGY